MFTEPQPTKFDLNFRLFGTHVRVHPFFWLVTLIMGFSSVRLPYGFLMLLVWVACVFVSILVHEFGHILMGRAFGSRGHIVLYGFGGLAVPDRRLPNRWHRILVSLAGPGAQFLLLGVTLVVAFSLYLGSALPFANSLRPKQQHYGESNTEPPKGSRHLGEETDDSQEAPALKKQRPSVFRAPSEDNLTTLLLWAVCADLIMINLFWPILNLMPLWPLDGGRVCRELCEWRMPGSRGIRVSLYISIGAAIAGAVFMMMLSDWYLIFFFGMFGFIAYRELQFLNAGGGGGPGWGPQPPRSPWEADPDWWKSGRRDPWS